MQAAVVLDVYMRVSAPTLFLTSPYQRSLLLKLSILISRSMLSLDYVFICSGMGSGTSPRGHVQ